MRWLLITRAPAQLSLAFVRASLFSCSLLALTVPGAVVLAEDGNAILQLALNSRLALASGSVEVHGRQWFPDGEIEESINLVFDEGGKSLRYTYKSSGQGLPICFIRNQKESLLYVEGAYVVTRDVPDKLYEIPNAKPIDPRIAGFSTWHGVSTRISFQSIIEAFGIQPIDKAIKNQDGTWSIEWVLNKQERDQVRKVIRFDPKWGYAPVAMAMQLEQLDGQAVGETEPWVDVRVTYSVVDDFAVPVRWVLDDLYGKRVGFDWHMDWKSVNRPIDDAMFEMASLAAADGSVIKDNRFSKPVIEGIVGKVPDLPKPVRRRRWMAYMVGANVCAVAILVVLGYRARRQRKRDVIGAAQGPEALA